MFSHKIITQSEEIQNKIPQISQLTFKEASYAKQQLHCLDQINQISHWNKSQKRNLNTQNDLKINTEKVLIMMPSRQQILKSIDFGIQQHMKKFNIFNKSGSQFLSQSMNVVENTVAQIFQHVEDLKNRESQLLLEIDFLSQKLQYFKESQLSNTKKDSTYYCLQTDRSNITTETSNSHQLISELTTKNEQLNAQLEHSNLEIINARKRIDQLQIKISSQNVQFESLQFKLNQLLSQQRSYKDKIKRLQVKLEEAESEINNFNPQKNKLKTKINRLSSDFAAISIQLTKEKNQRLDLQSKLNDSKQKDQSITDEKTKKINLELIETKKKMEHMIKKTTFYQNKIIDLQLQNQNLNTQLTTLKTNIQDKLLKSKQNKLQQSRKLQKSRKLQQSRKLQESTNLLQNKISCPNPMIDSIQQNIKQVQQTQIILQLQSQISNKKPNKSRIFGDVKKMSSLSTQNSSLVNKSQ